MSYKKYPKRDAIKNSIIFPNEIFTLNLRSHEIAIYGYLLYCEDRKTCTIHPIQ
ncbi:MAG: hypothetical protein R3Y06_09600 [Faecalibacterium sp.]